MTHLVRWGILGAARIAEHFVVPAIQRSRAFAFSLESSLCNQRVIDRILGHESIAQVNAS